MGRSSRACLAGVRYLVSRAKNGTWTGFPTLAGTSDCWVSAVVLAHVWPLADRESRLHLRIGLRWLATCQVEGAWGYNQSTPPDADTTAWAILALRGAGMRFDLKGARRFINDNRCGQGVGTYSEQSGISRYIDAPTMAAVEGWTMPHPDVTVAALLAGAGPADRATRLAAWVLGLQSAAGWIPAYWWRSQIYTSGCCSCDGCTHEAIGPTPIDELALSAHCGASNCPTEATASGGSRPRTRFRQRWLSSAGAFFRPRRARRARPKLPCSPCSIGVANGGATTSFASQRPMWLTPRRSPLGTRRKRRQRLCTGYRWSVCHDVVGACTSACPDSEAYSRRAAQVLTFDPNARLSEAESTVTVAAIEETP